MIEPWSEEGQLTLDRRECVCFGTLGCAHVVPIAPGRLSPGQRDFDARLLEIGGFDLATVVARPQRPLALPPVMPVVDGSTDCRGVYRPTVVVPLDVVRQSRLPDTKLQGLLDLPDDVDVLVSLFAKDRELEAIWEDRRAFVSLLVALRPSAIVAPSYSTWAGDPWTEHRYSMKRSFEYYRILQDHGLVAIPHLAWGRKVDAEDLAAWLNRNNPETVTLDAQCLGPMFDRWVGELGWLRGRLERVPSLLVGGIHPGIRLHRIVEAWPESSFIYNGIRFAASHRELRVGADGAVHRVRHASAKPDQPRLRLGLPEDDLPPAILYQRSLGKFERAVAASRDARILALGEPTSAPLFENPRPQRAQPMKMLAEPLPVSRLVAPYGPSTLACQTRG